jgi:hypothetical protein
MGALLAGVASFVAAVVVFWRCLPRYGKAHPIMGTPWEPYIGVGITSGVTFGLTLVLLGLTQLAAN